MHLWAKGRAHIFAHNYEKGVEQTWGVRWICMHMYTDACTHSNQGIGPDKGDWDMHMGPHRVNISMQLCKGVRVDLGSQVDRYTYTDACTHSNEGKGPEGGDLDMLSG